MSVVDPSRIRVGDLVKIRYLGLVSEDWQEVTADYGGIRLVGGTFEFAAVEFLEHKPGLRTVTVEIPTNPDKEFSAPTWHERDQVHAYFDNDNDLELEAATMHHDHVRDFALWLLANTEKVDG